MNELFIFQAEIRRRQPEVINILIFDLNLVMAINVFNIQVFKTHEARLTENIE